MLADQCGLPVRDCDLAAGRRHRKAGQAGPRLHSTFTYDQALNSNTRLGAVHKPYWNEMECKPRHITYSRRGVAFAYTHLESFSSPNRNKLSRGIHPSRAGRRSARGRRSGTVGTRGLPCPSLRFNFKADLEGQKSQPQPTQHASDPRVATSSQRVVIGPLSDCHRKPWGPCQVLVRSSGRRRHESAAHSPPPVLYVTSPHPISPHLTQRFLCLPKCQEALLA